MKDAFYLAVRYLRSSWARTAVLVLGTSVALFLPLFTALAAARLEAGLEARAEASPILLGRSGNEVDLTLASLYFRSGVETTTPFGVGRRAGAGRPGSAVPLYVRHTVGGSPLVGTSPEYFSRRGVIVAEGRLPAVLGEVAVGSELAADAGLGVGDRVRSDLHNLYNLSGAYPLLLDVVGILERSGTPDDRVFFTDIKTTWALDGLFHGHGEVTPEGALNPDAAEDENLEATAALFLFSEINDANRAGFHLHGSVDDAPTTAFLVFPPGFPEDRRIHDQVLGDFAVDPLYQAVRPTVVVRSLLDIVFRLQDALGAYFALVALSTVAFFVLVISLSLRLRRDELRLMARLGCDRTTLWGIVGAEIALVMLAALAVAGSAVALGLQLLARYLP